MSIFDDALGVLGKVAPTIATMLGGPLAGTDALPPGGPAFGAADAAWREALAAEQRREDER